MPRVLEETTTQQIDRDHIVRRVNDWVDRINALYQQIQECLPTGWTSELEGKVQMQEELMQKFEVPAQDLPILQLLHEGRPSARVEPRGLWIIGANGRLDLFSGAKHHIIVDTAENLQPAEWQIAPFSHRQSLQPLTCDTFRAAL
jgi:hypothetical protein